MLAHIEFGTSFFGSAGLRTSCKELQSADKQAAELASASPGTGLPSGKISDDWDKLMADTQATGSDCLLTDIPRLVVVKSDVAVATLQLKKINSDIKTLEG